MKYSDMTPEEKADWDAMQAAWAVEIAEKESMQAARLVLLANKSDTPADIVSLPAARDEIAALTDKVNLLLALQRGEDI